MTKDELVKFVNNEITMSGALNIPIPESEIIRIIDNETNQIYDLNRDAVLEKYTIVPHGLFYTEEFRKTRTLQFPKCVKSVGKVEELKARSMMWGINDPDISFTRAFQADLWMSPMSGDTVAYRTIQWSMWNQMKQFNLVDIQHSWNRTNHTLFFKGHDPQSNVFIEIFEKVPEEDLWEDPWVRKFICAKCKKQVAKMLGLVTYTLLGGATINASVFSEDADNDIQQCTEYWDKINQPDWFIAFP
jgi:hypothetical protein